MGQDQSTWDYGVILTGKRSKPLPEIKSAHSHTLVCIDRKWQCKCGYKLGDGREAFKAPCGLAYPEIRITKPKKKGGRK